MSLLGFDATGCLALGQLSMARKSNTVLTGTGASCAVTPKPTGFVLAQSFGAAVASATGATAALGSKLAAWSAAGLVAGGAATSAVRLSSGAAGHQVDGNSAGFAMRLASPGAASGWLGEGVAISLSMPSDDGILSVLGADSEFIHDFEAWLPRPFDGAGAWTAPAAPVAAWTAADQSPANWISRSCRFSPPASIAPTSATMRGKPPETS
jgi:hypothetical protein